MRVKFFMTHLVNRANISHDVPHVAHEGEISHDVPRVAHEGEIFHDTPRGAHEGHDVSCINGSKIDFKKVP